MFENKKFLLIVVEQVKFYTSFMSALTALTQGDVGYGICADITLEWSQIEIVIELSFLRKG